VSLKRELIMLKPKFKDIYKPLVRIGEKIRIGFDSEAIEIEDADNSVENFINALDGTRDLAALSNVLGVPLGELREGIDTFNAFNLLENTNRVVNLSREQMDRYRANLNFFSNFSSLDSSNDSLQEKLINSTVAILGIGGSSLIAANLAGMGVGKIIGVDYDKVELSNLNRQFLYSQEDIGKLKTQAAEERLRKINSDIEIEMHNIKISNSKDLLSIIDEADIIINGIDQPPIMSSRWVNSACTYLKKSYLQGGVTNSRIILQKIIPELSCFDCYLINSLRNVEGFENQLNKTLNYNFSGRNTAYAPNISLMAGVFSTEVSNTLLSINEVEETSYTLDINNVKNLEYNKYPIERVDYCPTCSKSHNFIEPISFEELTKLTRTERAFS
jgi:molybdopterin-synthase adenylyltransferase